MEAVLSSVSVHGPGMNDGALDFGTQHLFEEHHQSPVPVSGWVSRENFSTLTPGIPLQTVRIAIPKTSHHLEEKSTQNFPPSRRKRCSKSSVSRFRALHKKRLLFLAAAFGGKNGSGGAGQVSRPSVWGSGESAWVQCARHFFQRRMRLWRSAARRERETEAVRAQPIRHVMV